MTRKDLRESIQRSINKYNETDMLYIDLVFILEELAVEFSKQELSKLHQPTVISSVCDNPKHDVEVKYIGHCKKCKSEMFL